jgi:hypothetical protein
LPALLTPSRQATAAAVVLCAAVLPDLNRLTTDERWGWVAYLTLKELTIAGLCLLLPKHMARAGFLWFLTQAVDELTEGNVWSRDTIWEYVAFLVLVLVTWILQTRRK